MSESRHDDLEEYRFEEGEPGESGEHEHSETHEPIVERADEGDGLGAKITKMVKDYGLYGIVALVLIVPAVMNLKDNILGPSKPKEAERQPLTFTQTAPTTPTASPAEAPTAAAPAAAPTSTAAGTIHRPNTPDTAVADLLPPPVKTPQPASKTGAHVPALTAGDSPSDMAQRLDTLEKSLAATGEQIKALVNQDVVAANEAQFKALNNRISSMGTAITELSRQLYAQQQMMGEIQQGLTAHAAASRKKEKAQQSDFPFAQDSERPAITNKSKLTLDAAIPGRAWLLGADGETSTVVEGDEIPGYGRVTKIDPSAGVVVTSSGRTIKAVDS